MAEGGIEEDSGDMLGPAAVPVHHNQQELNVKSEVSHTHNLNCFSTIKALMTVLATPVAFLTFWYPYMPMQ